MKYVLIITLIVLIVLVAIKISNQYRDKFIFFDDLYTFLDMLKMNVGFKQDKLDDMISKAKGNKHFDCFISDYKKFLTTNEISFSNLNLLNDDEKMELEYMLKNLGKYDQINEEKQIESFIKTISKNRETAEKEKDKLCPLIVKLALFLALGIVIILI